MPSSLGPAEIIAILVVALIVLGPHRLPEAGRQVGRALAEVRRWSQGFQSEVRNVLETEPVPTPWSPSAPSTSSSTSASSPAEPSPPTSNGSSVDAEAKDPPDAPVDPPTS